jgi:hypothetical protein
MTEGVHGRGELRFLFDYGPIEIAVHAIRDVFCGSSLGFAETERSGDRPATASAVRSPVDAVGSGFKRGRAYSPLDNTRSSGLSAALCEFPAVDLASFLHCLGGKDGGFCPRFGFLRPDSKKLYRIASVLPGAGTLQRNCIFPGCERIPCHPGNCRWYYSKTALWMRGLSRPGNTPAAVTEGHEWAGIT